MHIKLEDINTKKSNSTEISVLSNFDEMVERKSAELLASYQDNLLALSSVELVFFFDKSGSVSGTEATMCEYLRKIIDKYQQSNQNILFTFIVFSETDEILYYRCPLNQITKLSYIAIGGTSLYDSLFKNISGLIGNQMDVNGIASKTIVTIMTDGVDTTSEIHSEDDVKKLVQYTKSLGWEYIFLSKENLEVDSFIGIDRDHIGIYNNYQSIEKCFDSINKAIDDFVSSGIVDKDWKSPLNPNVLKLTKKED